MTSTWESRGIPNPGSDEAIERGCCCSANKNRNGRGACYGPDGPEFEVAAECPLHREEEGKPS